MSNRPRNCILYPGCLFHVAWQCHNKAWLLERHGAKQLYYELLLKYRDRYGMVFYAYHFMDNHAHLIGQLESVQNFSGFFRVVHNILSRQLNQRMERRGQVVMERLKSPPIENESHMLSAMAYADLNGVRAGKATSPDESVWSSYRCYAWGRADSLIVEAPSYLALSDNVEQRQKWYREMVEGMWHLKV